MDKLENFGNIINRANSPAIKSRCTDMSISDFKLAIKNSELSIFISYMLV